jgi:hypothetical protein
MTTYEFAIQLTQPKQKIKKSNPSKKSTKITYSEEQIYNAIKIVEGSVLGKMPNDNSVSPIIDETTALVDAAGKHHMTQEVFTGVGSSSEELYKYLKINMAPNEVKEHFKKRNDAFLQEYTVQGTGTRSVIHAVGPLLIDLLNDADEKQPFTSNTRDDERRTITLVKGLTPIYKNIFEIFCKSNLKDLRLVPISTGIFAAGLLNGNNYKIQKAMLMQQITCISILNALYEMNSKNKNKLKDHIFLCIWTSSTKHYNTSQKEALQWYTKNMKMLRGGALNFHSIKHKKRRKYSNINKAKLVKRTLRKRNTFSKYT